MRIIYFTRDYTPHDHRFLSALAETDHEVFFLRLERRNTHLEDRPLPPRITNILWRGGERQARLQDGIVLLRDLGRVIREIKPDLIHAGPIQKTAFLTALAGYHPLVSMSWGSDLLKDAEQNWMWRWATGFTLRHTAILIGDCQAVSEKAQTYGFPERRTVLFPWGVDLKHFIPGTSAAFRERLGWQEDAFVLLSLRSWEPLYGVDVFLLAFAQAAKLVPELMLILLGGGSQAPLLRQILMKNNLMDRVYFGGQVSQNDLPEFYRAADLYVSASHSDGSSVSLMEALASGRPVLVSDIPGNLEWITDGVQGWIFPDGDQDAICAGILKAFHQRERLSLYGQAARSLAEKRANWSDNFQHLMEAYEMAITNGSKLSE